MHPSLERAIQIVLIVLSTMYRLTVIREYAKCMRLFPFVLPAAEKHDETLDSLRSGLEEA